MLEEDIKNMMESMYENRTIRGAEKEDVSRIAEIFVFNNRVNYYPIFGDEGYSFGELQVTSVVNDYLMDENVLKNTYVYDDGVVRGFIGAENGEIKKLYVDTFFQGRGIGAKLLEFAVKNRKAMWLWALEKNTKAIKFYENHGFHLNGEKVFEEGTTEYLVKMERSIGSLII